MDTGDKKNLPCQLFIIGALFFAFSPAILNVYLFHDDLFFWDQPSSHHIFPLICSESIYLGRFLGAIIFWAYFPLVKAVTDLNTVRLVTCLIISYCALRSYGVLLKFLKRPMDAALSTVILFSLPAFEIWVSHAGESFEVYALFFVIIAVYAVDRIPMEGRLSNRIASLPGLVSTSSLICSWMIYPALATFYWALALVLILGQMENTGRGLRGKIENIYIPGLAAAFIYACIYGFSKHFIKLIFVNAYHPDALASNIVDKSLWFLLTVVPQSLNLWNIFPNKAMPVLFSLFIAGAVIITLRKARVFVILSLLILSYLPNLLVAVNFNPYRCGAGLTAVFVILLVWALRVYCRYLPGNAGPRVMTLILCIACIWGVGSSFYNIDRFRVKLSRLEYSFLRDSITHFHGKLKEIYIVAPKFDGLYHYYDEFGVCPFNFNTHENVVRLLNAVITGTPAGNRMIWDSYQNKPTYRYYFKEQTGQDHSAYSLLKIKVSGDAGTKLSDSTLYIDMNDLYGPLKQAMGRHYDFKVINKRSWAG
jgi:hypothetical protein